MWVSGRVFKAKGEVLEPDYNGEFHRPSDMKTITQRFYAGKRSRDVGDSPIPIYSEHDSSQHVGTLQHLYVDRDNVHRAIFRLNPASPLGKEYADRIRSGERPGLSWGSHCDVHANPEDPQRPFYKNKYVSELSLVKMPAHHADDTFVTDWADSLDELLKKEFVGAYGSKEEGASQPVLFLPSALKQEVKRLFELDKVPAFRPGEPEEEEQEAGDTVFDSQSATGGSDAMDVEKPEAPSSIIPPRMADQQQIPPPPSSAPAAEDKMVLAPSSSLPDGAAKRPAQAPPVDEPAAKKARTDAPAPTQYPVTPTDVHTQGLALSDAARELIQMAGLMNAPAEEQQAFIKGMFDKQLSKYQKQQAATQEALTLALRESGIPEEDIGRFVKEASQQPADSTAGQLIRTLTSVAAAGQARNQLLSAARSRQQQETPSPSQRSVVDVHQPSIYDANRSVSLPPLPSPLSAPPLPSSSSYGGGSNKSLDFSSLIMGSLRRPTAAATTTPAVAPQSSRLGEPGRESVPVETEDERQMREYMEDLKLTGGLRINRRIAPNAKLAITMLRTPDQKNQLDAIGIPDHIAAKIQPNEFTHRFLASQIYPDLEALKKKESYRYGDEATMSDFIQRGLMDGYPGWRPRIITGGAIAVGDELLA